MSQLIYRLKEFIGKLVTIAVILAVGYGGYSLYRQGAFRGGIAHTGKVILRQIPYFGTRFRHFIGSGKKSRGSYKAVSYGNKHRRGKSHRVKKYRHRRYR